MLIVFPYTKKPGSSDIYYCCCLKSDYAIYGTQIVTSINVPKGVSDEPEEAIQDFEIVLQLMAKPGEYLIYVEHKDSIQIISEVAVLKIN